MKVTVIMGSSRKNSRSRRVVEKIMEGARSAGHDLRVYDINDIPLLGCEGCAECRRRGVDCVREDGLKPYWQDLRESGALIVSAPNYNSQPSGAMITFLNRHYCMLDRDKNPRLDHDVRLIGVFAQGAPAPHPLYEQHYQWYMDCFRTKRIVDAGHISVGGDSDLSEDGEIMTRAFRMGAEL